MKPVRQTIFVATDPRGRGNCQSACLASLLELPLSETIDTTSDEVRDDWHGSINRWLALRGLKIKLVSKTDERLTGAYSIGIGPSPRGTFYHAVVCKSGRMVFDPHPSDDGVLEIHHHEILVPLSRAEVPA